MADKLNIFGNLDTIKTTLQGKFIVPPFSVLDARQGYWQRRKRKWIELGIKGELGREDNLTWGSEDDDVMNDPQLNCYRKRKKQKLAPGGGGGGCYLGSKDTKSSHKWKKSKIDSKEYNTQGWVDEKGIKGNCIEQTGASIFDPVLSELMYRWFCPANGKILDPFAGESTKGIVATCLGYNYTGIELRQGQVNANLRQAKKIGLRPEWIKGDANCVNKLLPKKDKYDLVFTSPPYYDLEIYSEYEKDGSAKQTYKEFMDWYYSIFKQVVEHLRKNRFLVVKVGEIRDRKTGGYHNFVGDNISCFLNLGLSYYNEIILVTAIGSLPIRISKQFMSGRKIGKTHQNILVFYKGDPKNVKEKFSKETINADIT